MGVTRSKPKSGERGSPGSPPRRATPRPLGHRGRTSALTRMDLASGTRPWHWAFPSRHTAAETDAFPELAAATLSSVAVARSGGRPSDKRRRAETGPGGSAADVRARTQGAERRTAPHPQPSARTLPGRAALQWDTRAHGAAESPAQASPLCAPLGRDLEGGAARRRGGCPQSHLPSPRGQTAPHQDRARPRPNSVLQEDPDVGCRSRNRLRVEPGPAQRLPGGLRRRCALGQGRPVACSTSASSRASRAWRPSTRSWADLTDPGPK